MMAWSHALIPGTCHCCVPIQCVSFPNLKIDLDIKQCTAEAPNKGHILSQLSVTACRTRVVFFLEVKNLFLVQSFIGGSAVGDNSCHKFVCLDHYCISLYRCQ